MSEQRVCCIKVVLPEKEMPALSVTIQRWKVARNGATEQWPLAVEVVMDQHGSQYLLLLVGRRIVRVAKEIVEKNSSAESIFVPWQIVEQLAGVEEGDDRRGKTPRPQTS